MKRPIRLELAAESDLDRLVDFLDAVAPDAARKAARLIRSGILALSDYPERGVAMGDERRQLYLRFGVSGYVVQYRVDPDAIVIARIFHMREDR